MPRIARTVGRKAGRLVGTVVNMQARIASVAEGAGLSEVQRDLTEGFTQLHAIRDEVDRSTLSAHTKELLMLHVLHSWSVLRMLSDAGATQQLG